MGPTEAVPTMEESVGDCESHDELAIAIPQVTPNQGTVVNRIQRMIQSNVRN